MAFVPTVLMIASPTSAQMTGDQTFPVFPADVRFQENRAEITDERGTVRIDVLFTGEPMISPLDFIRMNSYYCQKIAFLHRHSLSRWRRLRTRELEEVSMTYRDWMIVLCTVFLHLAPIAIHARNGNIDSLRRRPADRSLEPADRIDLLNAIGSAFIQRIPAKAKLCADSAHAAPEAGGVRMRIMGGRIDIASLPGAGTDIYVFVPLRQDLQRAAPDAEVPA